MTSRRPQTNAYDFHEIFDDFDFVADLGAAKNRDEGARGIRYGFAEIGKLRPSNIDASAGRVEEIQRIVERIRAQWPKVRIILRADSGFCREELMAWCETNAVGYVFGFTRNPRLRQQLSLFSDRLSTETMRASQSRLYFSSLAYVLMHALRRLALRGTEWATSQVDTLRLRLLKIAAEERITARRIWVRYSRAYP